MYKDIFAIDEIPFNERQKSDEPVNPYLLKNYSFFEPKLDKELYYNYFLRTILFDIDIMGVEDFLNFHFGKSRNPEKLLNIIELKIIPDINKIVSNSSFNGRALEYRNEKIIKHDFVETEGVVKNKAFDFQIFYHLTEIKKLKENLLQRIKIIKKYHEKYNLLLKGENPNLLTWSGRPSHLAFIIRTLSDEGYIKMPKKHDNEDNVAEFTRQIMNSFNILDDIKENSLNKYVSINNEKHQQVKENFERNGFSVPFFKVIG
jgi:hypothetical protein